MSRPSPLLLVAAPLLLAVGCSADGADGTDPEYQNLADQAAWQGSDRDAGLVHSITEYVRSYQVEIVCPKEGGWWENSLTIRITDDGKEVYAVKGHWETVFARWQNTLDIAEFNPIATGCAVRAVDLTTGEQLWRSPLKGSSCREHSKYRNRVTIETDGKVLVIRGNESYSRYLEYVDLKTGKALGHHEYKDR